MKSKYEPNEVMAGLLIFFIGMLVASFLLDSINTVVQFAISIGAIATAMAFFLAFRQSQNLAKRQIKSEERQNLIDAKQQEMWEAQQESIAFQKYQTHKLMFNDMLDAIERKYDSTLIFFDRDNLYTSIFPENNFSVCLTKAPILDTNDVKDNHLASIAVSFRNIIAEISKIEAKKDYRNTKGAVDTLHNVMMLCSLLNLKINTTPVLGDISFGQGFLLGNIFKPSTTFQQLTFVVNRIASFSEHPSLFNEDRLSIDYFIFCLRNYALNSPKYHVVLQVHIDPKHSTFLGLIYSCYEYVHLNQNIDSTVLFRMAVSIESLFRSSDAVQQTLLSKDLIKETLSNCFICLEMYRDESGSVDRVLLDLISKVKNVNQSLEIS